MAGRSRELTDPFPVCCSQRCKHFEIGGQKKTKGAY